jgi:lactonase family protein with 7-bladed beta-propeller
MKIHRQFLKMATLTVVAVMAVLLVSAQAQQNLVYINANILTPGGNGVIALVNDGAGNMSPLTGSPYATLGTGVGGDGNPLDDAQWDSDQELVINPAGTLLLSVNGGSNNLSSFKINADGTLTRVGSPISSGGTQPASIGYRDNALGNGVSLIVVANKDSDPNQTQTAPNYMAFKVSAGGVLSPGAGAPLTLPVGSSPAQVMMLQSGPAMFFGVQFLGKNVSSYTFTRSGIMSQANSLALPAAAVGGVFHPTLRQFYLTTPPISSINVMAYDRNGVITKVGNAHNQGLAVCWVAVNKAATRMYSAETLSGTMSVYDITNSKKPVQLQHIAVSGTGALPTHTRLDPTEKFLYILDRLGVLHVLDVLADGTVAENHAPYNLGLPTGTVPLSVVPLLK